MASATVIHLVYAPLGEAPVARFLRSYDAHDAGERHDLVFLVNGGEPSWLKQTVSNRSIRIIAVKGQNVDLESYRLALSQLGLEEVVVFLNSYSEILAESWLTHYSQAARSADIGLVGAGGSFESMSADATWIRPRAQAETLRQRAWSDYQHLKATWRIRRAFPRFPNAHVRTNAFAIRRDVLARLHWPMIRDKAGAWRFESGYGGLSLQVKRLGLRVVVVDRRGQIYDSHEWPGSRTFRSGDQGNLIVADNRTRDYDAATTRKRSDLARAAWGTQAERRTSSLS